MQKEQEKSVESSSRGVSGDEVVSCSQSHGHALIVTHGDLPLQMATVSVASSSPLTLLNKPVCLKKQTFVYSIF